MITPEEKAARQAEKAKRRAERTADREGRQAFRSDQQTLRNYNELVGDILKAQGVDDYRDYLRQGRDRVREEMQALRPLDPSDYKRREQAYLDYSSILPEQYREPVLGGLAKTAAVYDKYNLGRFLNTDIGGGGSITTGFNPRQVGYHTLDLGDRKYQRVGNMLDFADNLWGKTFTAEEAEQFGKLRAKPKMGKGIYSLNIGSNAYRNFTPGTRHVPKIDPVSGEAMVGPDGQPIMVEEVLRRPETGNSGKNYVSAYLRQTPDGLYSIVPKEYSPFKRYAMDEPDKGGGFLGSVAPLVSIAGLLLGGIPGMVMQGLSVANAADAGNWAGAALGGLGMANELGVLGEAGSTASKITGIADKAAWQNMATNAALAGSAAAIDGRDIVPSMAGAFGPSLDVGPAGGLILTAAAQALRNKGGNNQLAPNLVTQTPQTARPTPATVGTPAPFTVAPPQYSTRSLA